MAAVEHHEAQALPCNTLYLSLRGEVTLQSELGWAGTAPEHGGWFLGLIVDTEADVNLDGLDFAVGHRHENEAWLVERTGEPQAHQQGAEPTAHGGGPRALAGGAEVQRQGGGQAVPTRAKRTRYPEVKGNFLTACQGTSCSPSPAPTRSLLMRYRPRDSPCSSRSTGRRGRTGSTWRRLTHPTSACPVFKHVAERARAEFERR